MLKSLMVLSSWIALAGCAGGTASYTRLRHQAERGTLPPASEIRPSHWVTYHARGDAPRPELTLPAGSSSLLIHAELGNAVLPIELASRPVLQVSLRGGAATERYPTFVVVVIDVSGSMNERDKIGAVRHALARFVETLDDSDQLAIVAFASDAHVALQPTAVASARQEILQALSGLTAHGGTNIDAGLRAALDLAHSHDHGQAVRIVFISDGVATRGVTDPTMILAGIEESTTPITTVGLGQEIDFALLGAIAERSGGAFHFLDQPSEVERIFATEIAALTEIAARDVIVRVTLPGGWRLGESLDERTVAHGAVLETRIGDLGGDEVSVTLAELEAPARPDQEAVPIEVDYLDPSGQRQVLATYEVQVHRAAMTHYDPVPGGTVLRNSAVARAAMAVRNAAVYRSPAQPEASLELVSRAADHVCDARARLLGTGETHLGESLEEVAQMLRNLGAHTETPSSTHFAGWRAGAAVSAVQTTAMCP